MTKLVIQIDADNTVGQLLTSILGPKGYEIDMCRSGQDALARMKAKAYDIAIVGDQLDDLDGIGFLIQLRKAHSRDQSGAGYQSLRQANFMSA